MPKISFRVSDTLYDKLKNHSENQAMSKTIVKILESSLNPPSMSKSAIKPIIEPVVKPTVEPTAKPTVEQAITIIDLYFNTENTMKKIQAMNKQEINTYDKMITGWKSTLDIEIMSRMGLSRNSNW